jgi:hypothetical protein
MIGKRVILAAGISFLFSLPANAQMTLYVNGTSGNDSVPRASNSASTPWRTIGRAAWGSTNRGAQNSAEAARAGDTVNVASGTYTYTGGVNDRFSPVYTTANSGTANAYITFTCTGDCVLTAPSANGPVIGASERDYVKWFADVNTGNSWIINACGLMAGCPTANVVNTTADTGPVVCHASTGCWVEGTVIDGGAAIDFRDNYNAFRIENCTSCVLRNNSAANFRGNNHNQSIFTLYGARNVIIEHNVGTNAGAGVYFKDTDTTNLQSGNVVRYNRFDRMGEVFAFSVTAEGRSFLYQNIGMNSAFGVSIVGGGLSGDWIFNNTFYRMSTAGVGVSQSGSGGRFWNNICVECDNAVNTGMASMVGEGVIDLEHNVYYAYRQFYAGTDATLSFTGFKSRYPSHEQAAPASVDANPLFVNAAGSDFRLCTGAGAPAASCTGASPALNRGVDHHDIDADGSTTDTIHAGAYLRNNEFIGLATAVPSAPRNFRITGTP